MNENDFTRRRLQAAKWQLVGRGVQLLLAIGFFAYLIYVARNCHDGVVVVGFPRPVCVAVSQ